MRPFQVLVSIAGSALALPLVAQTPVRLVAEGDLLPGIGAVDDIQHVAIASDGTWGAIVATDADPDSDTVVLVDGVVVLREGDAVPGHGGYVYSRPNDLDLAAGFPPCISIVAHAGSDYRSSAVVGDRVIAWEGSAVGAPELSTGTPWVSVTAARAAPDGSVLISGQFDDPDIPRLVDYGLVRATPAGGGVWTYSAFFKTGDPIEGIEGGYVDYLPSSFQSFEAAGNGHWAANVNVSGSTELDAYVIDGRAVIVRGEPSFVPGLDWGLLLPTSLSVNALGEYAAFARVDEEPAGEALVARQNRVLVQVGDSLPDTLPWSLRTISYGGVEIADCGRTVWYGTYSPPLESERGGFFLGEDALVQIGDPLPLGRHVDLLDSLGDNSELSVDGRWFVFVARDETGARTAWRLDLGGVAPMRDSGLNAARLRLQEGLALPGHTLALRFEDGPAPGSVAFLLGSLRAAPGWPPTGLELPFGEVLIDLAPDAFLGARLVGTWVGTPRRTALSIPDDAVLVGRTLYLQGLFIDRTGTSGRRFHPTGGLAVTIGEP